MRVCEKTLAQRVPGCIKTMAETVVKRESHKAHCKEGYMMMGHCERFGKGYIIRPDRERGGLEVRMLFGRTGEAEQYGPGCW